MFSRRATVDPSPDTVATQVSPVAVVDHNGRTDVAANLYRSGTPVEREVTAKMMLNAGQRLLDDVKALEVLEWFSGGATTTLRAEAEALIIRALWMAPTGIGIKIGSAWFRLQGLTPEGVVRYGRKGPDGELINVGEVVATDVEDVAL